MEVLLGLGLFALVFGVLLLLLIGAFVAVCSVLAIGWMLLTAGWHAWTSHE